jgi:hypothetical protein
MLYLKWGNATSNQWHRGQMEYNPPPEGRMSTLPSDVMQPKSATTDMTMTVALQDALNMGEMICTWWMTISDAPGSLIYWYATQLYQPINVGHAGPSAYYAICSGLVARVEDIPTLRMDSITNSPGQDLWRRPVDNPAERYLFTAAADQLPLNFKIEYIPIANGEDLSVAVAMSNITIVFDPEALPKEGKVGISYGQQLTGKGDWPPFVFSLLGRALPAGLALSPQGSLSGTPVASGTYAFTIRATDTQGNFSDHNYTLIVTA